ncbi:MAG: hypothetical protein ACR2NL_08680 [Acidimicrobiia bacterium]
MNNLGWLIFLFVIPLGVLWAALIVDLVRRDDINLGRKALWAALTLITAEFGAAVYIAMRPIRFPEDAVSEGVGNEMAEAFLSSAESGDVDRLEGHRSEALRALRG